MAIDQMHADCLRELEEVKSERDALAAHVERLGALGTMVRDAAVDTGMEPDEFWDRIEKWETGWIDTPAFRSDRLKLQWQADILDRACDEGKWGCELRHMATELRRQAEVES